MIDHEDAYLATLPKTTAWKAGDWAIHDLKVVQVKEIRDGGMSVSDGFFETSGRLAEYLRPLTLQSKRIVETFDTYYMRLRQIDGEAGFNYPDIHRHFSQLALDCIDQGESKEPYEKALEFVKEARDYKTPIQGVNLFRRKLRA